MRVAIAGAAALTAEGHVMNLGDEAIADTLGAAVVQHATFREWYLRSTFGWRAGAAIWAIQPAAVSCVSSARWPRQMRC